MSQPSSAIERYACPGCQATMAFDPKGGKLKCAYCGRTQALPQVTTQMRREALQEKSFEAFVNANQIRIAALSTTAQEVKCPGCRASLAIEPPDVADQCPFCGTHIVAQPKMADPTLAPAGVVPFQIGRKAAQKALRDWLAVRWDWTDLKRLFLPNRLQQLAQQETLIGVYLPFWTYDCQTVSSYRGERGEYYYVTETYTTTNSEGERETKTRSVRKTRWYSASGQVSRFFDDVLVPASHSSQYAPTIWGRVEVAHLQPYDPKYLAGFKAQRPQISLKQGFENAKPIMADTIRSDVCRDIGGDTQRIHSVSTAYSQQTFKHILLPVWMTSYRFGGKQYQVAINAQTGKVLGDRPYSPWKIALAVTVTLLVAAGIIFVVHLNQ